MTCIRDLMSLVDEIAPWNTAVDWDNSGLMVGQSSARVETVALALDPSPKHIQAAHARQAQVLLTHHPLIFKPLKKIDFEDNIGLAIQKAIRLGVGIISAHTNLDQARQGVARALAEKIGLEWQAPLEPTVVEKRYKVIFQAPERLAMEIEKTLSNWSAESVEPVSVNRLFDMRDGGASSNGTPTMVRIEAMADDRTLRPMLRAVESIPEVAAIKPEIYGLTDDLARKGFGCIGKFTQPVLFTRLVAELKEKLKANSLRYLHVPDLSGLIPWPCCLVAEVVLYDWPNARLPMS